MSLQIVGSVIQCLLTDEELRTRFGIEPLETLVDLRFRGLELSADEMGLFIRTDVKTWSWSPKFFRARIH